MPRLHEIAEAAYKIYVSRIGREPAPMLADFRSLVKAGRVWVLDEPPVQGFVVMYPVDVTLHVENVAVDPLQHGRGFGGALVNFAESHAAAHAIGQISLYTNVHMTENLSFYPSLGYRETGRRNEDGFDRVYFSKDLPSSAPA